MVDDDKALKVKMENENKILENTIALLKTEAHKEMRILEVSLIRFIHPLKIQPIKDFK